MLKGKKLPLLAMAGAVTYGLNAYNGYMGTAGGGAGANGLKWNTLGIDNTGKFNKSKFFMNCLPLIVGIGGSLVAAKTGMNRYIAAIPFVKL